MACRVAFERGKERSVFLMIVHKEKDTSSWLLLVEELYSREGLGLVRVIAPLAGSKVSQLYQVGCSQNDV